MAEEKIEETIENPEEEEEPTEEKPQEEEQEPSKKPEKTASEIEEANKKLYARMKKAEEEAKLAKEELETMKKKPSETPTDVMGLAKTIAALREYNSDELGDIELIAKAKGISLSEAAKTEEAKILVAARRVKVAKEQSMPEPSTKQGKGESSKPLEEMTLDEKNDWFVKRGFVKGFPKPKKL